MADFIGIGRLVVFGILIWTFEALITFCLHDLYTKLW